MFLLLKLKSKYVLNHRSLCWYTTERGNSPQPTTYLLTPSPASSHFHCHCSQCPAFLSGTKHTKLFPALGLYTFSHCVWNILPSTFWSCSTPGICSYATSSEEPSLTSSSFRSSFPCFPHGIFYHCHYFIYCLFLSMFIFLTRIGVSWWQRNSCLLATELQDLEQCPIHDRHSIFYFF